MKVENPSASRRSFFSRFWAAAGGAGAALIAANPALSQSSKTAWQPAAHEQDDWLDRVPGKHRFLFDTTTPQGFGGALLFSNNYFEANRTGYGLQNADLAVVIVARHNSTPFVFNDAMWAKYGGAISQQSGFTDPKSKQPPTNNVYNASGYGTTLASFGITLDSVLKRGAKLAVCQMATRAYAGAIARASGGTTDAVYEELTANLVSNSHLVPAGIVAVNRGQERGYSLVNVF